jgi:hypothetical protein
MPSPLGNGFCRVIFGLAHKGNNYILTKRMYGGRVFETNPACLEVVTSGRSGPRLSRVESASKGLQKTVMLLVRFRAFGGPKRDNTVRKGGI